MSNSAALVAYPLSRQYRQDLVGILGQEPTYLLLSELRQMSLPRMIRQLRSLNVEVLVIPLEDVNSRAILPVLAAVAAIARSCRLEVVQPDLTRQSLTRRQAILWLTGTLGASTLGALAATRCALDLRRLLAAPRQYASYEPGRFLYLKTNLWFGVKAGGSVGHIAGVVNELARRGLPVSIASAEAPMMLDEAVEFRELEPLRIYGLPSELNLYRFHRSIVRQLRGAAARSSVVYQRLSVGNYAGVKISRALGIPLVIEYNGSEAWVARNWGRPLRFDRLAVRAEESCLRHAHAVVTVSEVLRDELIDRGVEPERIATYPNCVDPRVFNPDRFEVDAIQSLRDQYDIPRDALLVTFIGTFGQWHGVDRFAEAIRTLVDEHADELDAAGVHFMLVGDGMRRAEVANLLSPQPYAAYVTFTGLVPQPDAPLHLAASDVVVSPHVPNADGTPFFGSPTKLFEYMAMGKPIVASDLDQIGDVFHGSPRATQLANADQLPDTAMAILVQPGDVSDLVSGIRLLVVHPEWHSVLGSRARDEANAKYLWQHHVERILSVVRGEGKGTG